MADDDNDTSGGASQLVTVNQNGVVALNAILQAIKANTAALQAVFPQGTGVSTTATAGAQTLPANPAGFVNVTLPNGSQARVPYYNP